MITVERFFPGYKEIPCLELEVGEEVVAVAKTNKILHVFNVDSIDALNTAVYTTEADYYSQRYYTFYREPKGN